MAQKLSADKGFTKISNDIINKTSVIESLETKGAYMLIASFYNNPNHKTNYLGDKTYFRTLSTDGFVRFERVWKELYNLGILKREVYPIETNRFENVFRLLSKPSKIVPLYYAKNKDIRAGKHLGSRYTVPSEKYTEISTALLRDKSLALRTKGLYAVLKHYISYASTQGQVLSKTDLRYKTNATIHQFNKAWRELIDHGYFRVIPVYAKGHRGIAYHEYVFNDGLQPAINVAAKIENSKTAAAKLERSKEQREETKKLVIAEFKEKISYSDILEEVQQDSNFFLLNDYDLSDVDEYIELIARYCTSEQPHQLIRRSDIDHDDVIKTLYKLNKAILCYTIQRCNAKEIRDDCRTSNSYRLLALYNNAKRYLEDRHSKNQAF